MSKQMVNCRWDDLVRIEGTERAVTGPGSDWLHYHDCYKLLLEACKATVAADEASIAEIQKEFPDYEPSPPNLAITNQLKAAIAAAEGETK